jgi:hypothetical protein
MTNVMWNACLLSLDHNLRQTIIGVLSNWTLLEHLIKH